MDDKSAGGACQAVHSRPRPTFDGPSKFPLNGARGAARARPVLRALVPSTISPGHGLAEAGVVHLRPDAPRRLPEPAVGALSLRLGHGSSPRSGLSTTIQHLGTTCSRGACTAQYAGDGCKATGPMAAPTTAANSPRTTPQAIAVTPATSTSAKTTWSGASTHGSPRCSTTTTSTTPATASPGSPNPTPQPKNAKPRLRAAIADCDRKLANYRSPARPRRRRHRRHLVDRRHPARTQEPRTPARPTRPRRPAHPRTGQSTRQRTHGHRRACSPRRSRRTRPSCTPNSASHSPTTPTEPSPSSHDPVG